MKRILIVGGVSCQSGQRSYFAARLMGQRGYRTRNLTGSYRG